MQPNNSVLIYKYEKIIKPGNNNRLRMMINYPFSSKSKKLLQGFTFDRKANTEDLLKVKCFIEEDKVLTMKIDAPLSPMLHFHLPFLSHLTNFDKLAQVVAEKILFKVAKQSTKNLGLNSSTNNILSQFLPVNQSPDLRYVIWSKET